MNLLIQVYKSSRFHCMHQKKSNLKQNMKLTFIALFVAATVNGQDYFENVDKRGGDARFATGVMGAGFNRISKNANYSIIQITLDSDPLTVSDPSTKKSRSRVI